VHPRIRSARALDLDWGGKHLRERLLDDLLNGDRVRLPLPAGVAGAEVLKREKIAHVKNNEGYRRSAALIGTRSKPVVFDTSSMTPMEIRFGPGSMSMSIEYA